MRFDLPHDLPRRRQPEPTPSAPPLVPSPLDQQREERERTDGASPSTRDSPARRTPESPLDRLARTQDSPSHTTILSRAGAAGMNCRNSRRTLAAAGGTKGAWGDWPVPRHRYPRSCARLSTTDATIGWNVTLRFSEQQGLLRVECRQRQAGRAARTRSSASRLSP